MNNGIFILIVFILILVSYLIFVNKRKKRNLPTDTDNTMASNKPLEKVEKQTATEEKKQVDEECCGQHEVCERDSLINTKIVAEYYDDEELDRFKGNPADSYSDEEIKMFENIFYTLKEYDVAGWIKSLQIRGIELPDKIKEEALLIVKERRFKE